MKEILGSDIVYLLNEEVKLYFVLLVVFCVLYLDVKLKGRNLFNIIMLKGLYIGRV